MLWPVGFGFGLVFVIVSMTTDSLGLGGGRGGVHRVDTGACVLVSGGAANPARALGPVIVSLKFFSV